MADEELNKLFDEAFSDMLKTSKKDDTKKQAEIPEVPSEEEMDKFFDKFLENLKNQELPTPPPVELDNSMGQIFNMMQSLLSKELLLPALTDLSPKFDTWLKKNGANLSKEDKKRYKKQCSIIKEMIEVFDNKTLNEEERFEKNVTLMETMQSLGSPPEELIVPNEGLNRCSII